MTLSHSSSFLNLIPSLILLLFLILSGFYSESDGGECWRSRGIAGRMMQAIEQGRAHDSGMMNDHNDEVFGDD